MRKNKKLACILGGLLSVCACGVLGAATLSVTPETVIATAETTVYPEVADDKLTLAPVENVYGMTSAGFTFTDSTTAYGVRPFKENTLYQFRFSIDEKGSSNEMYSFVFAGGGTWDSYALHMNYKTGKIGYGSSVTNAEKNVYDFGLTYGEVYSLQLAAISLYDTETVTEETLPVGERIIIKITNADGSKKKEIAENYVGDENRSSWANKYGQDDAPNPKRAIGSTLNLYVNNMTGFSAKMYAYDNNNTIYYEMADADMPVVYLETLVPMNATYPIEKQIQSNLVFQAHKLIEFDICVQEKGGWNGKFVLAFGGGGLWNSYAVCINYTTGTIGLGYSPNSAEATISAQYPAVKDAWGKTFTVRLGLMDIYNNEELTGERKGERMLFSITDGENAVETAANFVGENRCGFMSNEQANPDGDYGLLIGTFINEPATFKGMLLPADYKRAFNVTVEYDGGYEFQEITYGDTYDFTSVIPAKPYYTLTGLTGTIEGKKTDVPLSGKWTTDVTVPEADGSYVADLTPVYTAIEYDVTYTIEHATVGNVNPSTITADDGDVALKAPQTLEDGYAFLGWYTDAAKTKKVTSIAVTGENITLYGKTAMGYTLTLVYPNGAREEVGVNGADTYVFPTTKVEGYETISGWKTQDGAAVTQITPSKNETYYAVAAPENYTVTYALDGGINATENPASFTVETDTVTLKNATKEGYIFVGWYNDDGANVTTIEKGATGNLTLNALFVKDTLPAQKAYVQSSTAQNIPLVDIPFASYTVALKQSEETQTAIENGTAVFDTAGTYTLVYTITLPSGELVKEIAVSVAAASITVNGEYKTSYTVGETLTLLTAETTAVDGMVSISVQKDGVAVNATGSILLEKGTYTVTYTAENAEETFTFTVAEKVESEKGCGATLTGYTAIFSMLTVLGGALAVGKKKRK